MMGEQAAMRSMNRMRSVADDAHTRQDDLNVTLDLGPLDLTTEEDLDIEDIGGGIVRPCTPRQARVPLTARREHQGKPQRRRRARRPREGACAFACMPLCVSVCVRVCACVSVCLCVRACVCVCACMRIHFPLCLPLSHHEQGLNLRDYLMDVDLSLQRVSSQAHPCVCVLVPEPAFKAPFTCEFVALQQSTTAC
jgi:hypothetical protein